MRISTKTTRRITKALTLMMTFFVSTLLIPEVFAESNEVGSEYSSTVTQEELAIIVNGETVNFYNGLGQPFITEEGRTLVPLRGTAEAYGCDVSWDAENYQAVVNFDDHTVTVPIDQYSIFTDSGAIQMDTYARIIDDRTYLPIRFVMEAVGATVTWDEPKYTITINNSEEEIAQTIESITGTDSINTNISYDQKGSILIDGTESLITVPESAETNLIIEDGFDNVVEMDLSEVIPETSTCSIASNGTFVYSEPNDENTNVSIAIQPLREEYDEGFVDESIRTLIVIESADAPKDYSFELTYPENQKLMTASEYLGEEYDTGEVYLIDTDCNEIVNVFDPAWAVDANGNAIDTFYTVNGNVLTQTVNFDEDTAFPVTADPSLWQITKCGAAITGALVSAFFGSAKILKIKKYIKAAGGIKKASQGVIKGVQVAKRIARRKGHASKWWKYVKVSELTKELGGAVGNLCGEILGIDKIRNNCSF